MRLTIHQPEHLPWLGYFGKAAAADELVLLDSVPYRHHYFQNRNRIVLDGRVTWLTVPVLHRGHLDGTIAGIEIDYAQPWQRKYVGTLGQAYARAAHAAGVLEPLFGLIEAAPAHLADLNTAIIELMLERLQLGVPTVRASALPARGRRSELLAEICRIRGATSYLSGPSGRDYLDLDPFRRHGIAVEFYDFVHPTYAQPYEGGFVPQLSVVDLVAHHGWSGAAATIAEAVAASAAVLAVTDR